MDRDKTIDSEGRKAEVKPGPAASRTFWDTINPGYVLAGLATLLASWFSIDGHFAKNLNDDKAYKPLKKKRKEAMKQAREAAHGDPHGDRVLYTTEVKKADSKYTKDLDEAVLKDTGISNTFQKFQVLKEHQKWQVGLTVAAVVSVALGAAYSYARHRMAAEKINRKMAENSDRQVGQ